MTINIFIIIWKLSKCRKVDNKMKKDKIDLKKKKRAKIYRFLAREIPATIPYIGSLWKAAFNEFTESDLDIAMKKIESFQKENIKEAQILLLEILTLSKSFDIFFKNLTSIEALVKNIDKKLSCEDKLLPLGYLLHYFQMKPLPGESKKLANQMHSQLRLIPILAKNIGIDVPDELVNTYIEYLKHSDFDDDHLLELQKKNIDEIRLRVILTYGTRGRDLVDCGYNVGSINTICGIFIERPDKHFKLNTLNKESSTRLIKNIKEFSSHTSINSVPKIKTDIQEFLLYINKKRNRNILLDDVKKINNWASKLFESWFESWYQIEK